MTPKLEEALKGFPLYSQDGKKGEAICCAIFVIGRVRWFIIEGEREGNDLTMFGIVIGLMEDEYGYVSLNEMSGIETVLELTLSNCTDHLGTVIFQFVCMLCSSQEHSGTHTHTALLLL